MQQNFVAFDFQQFVQRRFRFSRVQILTLVTLAMVEINDGIQAITISLLTPILKEELKLSENQVSIITSSFFIGVGVGALASGILSNKHGRKKTLLVGTLIQLMSTVFLAFNISYAWLCMCRLLYGIGFGSTLAVATVIITELMPINIRGRALLVVSFVSSVGKMGGVGLAFLFINGQNKQVSKYMLSSAVISFLAVFLVCLFIKQSYRFLLFKKKYEQAYIIMDEIILENDKEDVTLQDTQKQSIQNWSQRAFNAKSSNSSTVKMLYECKRVVILLSIGWFLINFIYFGEMFIVPFMLTTKHGGLMQYFWMTLGEIPSLLLTFTLIQRQGWGRKSSLISFFIGTGIFCILTVQYLNSTTLFFSKMLMKAVFQMLYPFTSESYPTSVRSIGFAFNSFFGRIGSTIMPFIIYPLYNHYPKSPFFILALLCFFGALAIKGVKDDTLLKPLDDLSASGFSQKKQLRDFNEEKFHEIQVSTMPESQQ